MLILRGRVSGSSDPRQSSMDSMNSRRGRRTRSCVPSFLTSGLTLKKFEHGATDYTRKAILNLLGRDASIVEDLVNIGFLKESRPHNEICYQVPHVYRHCLQIKQGFNK